MPFGLSPAATLASVAISGVVGLYAVRYYRKAAATAGPPVVTLDPSSIIGALTPVSGKTPVEPALPGTAGFLSRLAALLKLPGQSNATTTPAFSLLTALTGGVGPGPESNVILAPPSLQPPAVSTAVPPVSVAPSTPSIPHSAPSYASVVSTPTNPATAPTSTSSATPSSIFIGSNPDAGFQTSTTTTTVEPRS